MLGPDGAHLVPGPVLAGPEGPGHQRQLPGAAQLQAVKVQVLVVDGGAWLASAREGADDLPQGGKKE